MVTPVPPGSHRPGSPIRGLQPSRHARAPTRVGDVRCVQGRRCSMKADQGGAGVRCTRCLVPRSPAEARSGASDAVGACVTSGPPLDAGSPLGDRYPHGPTPPTMVRYGTRVGLVSVTRPDRCRPRRARCGGAAGGEWSRLRTLGGSIPTGAREPASRPPRGCPPDRRCGAREPRRPPHPSPARVAGRAGRRIPCPSRRIEHRP